MPVQPIFQQRFDKQMNSGKRAPLRSHPRDRNEEALRSAVLKLVALQRVSQLVIAQVECRRSCPLVETVAL